MNSTGHLTNDLLNQKYKTVHFYRWRCVVIRDLIGTFSQFVFNLFRKMTQDQGQLSKNTSDNNKDDKQNTKWERKDKDMQPTKVVIRRLPPTMTGEEFLEQISPLPENDYIYFVKGDLSLCHYAFSRGYINFVHADDVIVFKEKFDNYIFVDSKGNEYPAVVEFALFQKIPKNKVKKKDTKIGTIEDDADYKKFLDELLNPPEVTVRTVEQYLEEMEKRDKSRDGCRVTTPLIEYIKQKKLEKQKVREERREERRRREIERRRQREEERRRKRIEKERERQREKEKEKRKERVKEKAADEEQTKDREQQVQVKLLRNTTRGDYPERDTAKDRGSDKKVRPRPSDDDRRARKDSNASRDGRSDSESKIGKDRYSERKETSSRMRDRNEDRSKYKREDRFSERMRDRDNPRDRNQDRDRDRDRDRDSYSYRNKDKDRTRMTGRDDSTKDREKYKDRTKDRNLAKDKPRESEKARSESENTRDRDRDGRDPDEKRSTAAKVGSSRMHSPPSKHYSEDSVIDANTKGEKARSKTGDNRTSDSSVGSKQTADDTKVSDRRLKSAAKTTDAADTTQRDGGSGETQSTDRPKRAAEVSERDKRRIRNKDRPDMPRYTPGQRSRVAGTAEASANSSRSSSRSNEEEPATK
ncbi:PREDICTED: regulator of nonsense transcripts 3A-like isoform X2 [Priapulus caudatus]|uniref:Regulator of nonsense transcripts 3A-like isoform X2 n=1 Tax=Priapulus caudatus TaxID=37621 RepID=A0ABM1EKD7_PRICU|nr:PREDICTED: regulator of nonsense transcripts 3A-like isoform X2 [Priapulus caudatus]